MGARLRGRPSSGGLVQISCAVVGFSPLIFRDEEQRPLPAYEMCAGIEDGTAILDMNIHSGAQQRASHPINK
eukprot:4981621-Pyramimonas_sp.AAC.2